MKKCAFLVVGVLVLVFLTFLMVPSSQAHSFLQIPDQSPGQAQESGSFKRFIESHVCGDDIWE